MLLTCCILMQSQCALFSVLTVKEKIHLLIQVWEEGKLATSGAFDINRKGMKYVSFFNLRRPPAERQRDLKPGKKKMKNMVGTKFE